MTPKQIAKTLQAEIIGYKKAVEHNYFKLTRACMIFLDNQYYLDLGFKNSEDWVKEILGFK